MSVILVVLTPLSSRYDLAASRSVTSKVRVPDPGVIFPSRFKFNPSFTSLTGRKSSHQPTSESLSQVISNPNVSE